MSPIQYRRLIVSGLSSAVLAMALPHVARAAAWDVFGLQLGQSTDQATRYLGSKEPGLVAKAKKEYFVVEGYQSPTWYFGYTSIYNEKPGDDRYSHDFFTVVNDPRSDQIMALSRNYVFSTLSQPLFQSVIDQLIQKYGQPSELQVTGGGSDRVAPQRRLIWKSAQTLDMKTDGNYINCQGFESWWLNYLNNGSWATDHNGARNLRCGQFLIVNVSGYGVYATSMRSDLVDSDRLRDVYNLVEQTVAAGVEQARNAKAGLKAPL